MDSNPWQVDSIQDFSCLKCPECAFYSKEENQFQDHAIQLHPLSFVLFGKSEEHIDFQLEKCDYDSPNSFNESKTYQNIIEEEISAEDCNSIKNELLNEEAIEDDCLEYDPLFQKDTNTNLISVTNSDFSESSNEVFEHKCKECNYSSRQKCHLKLHVQSVHEGLKPYKCPTCDYSSSQNGALKQHIAAVHDRKKPFKCLTCDSSFTLNRSLKKHIESVHEGKKPFSCSKCNASFSEGGSLKRHLLSVHERKKPFNCPNCNSTFSQKMHLKRHIGMVHEAKKPYECSFCSSAFSLRQGLKNHIASIHDGIPKPFQCSVCPKGFVEKGQLLKHFSIVHEGKKSFKCPKCDNCFSQKGNLKTHMISVHDGIKRRDASKLKLSEKTKDSTDPLFIMAKPQIELDWSWKEKIKKEKMANVTANIKNSYIQ